MFIPRTRRLVSMTTVLMVALQGLGMQAALAQESAAPQDPDPGQIVTVVARDYSFEGLPLSVPSGTSFMLTNEGTEVHEMLLVRRNDGVTETWEELLALPDEEALQRVTVIGALASLPGETATGTMTATEEGEYLALCFIPQFTLTGPVVFPPWHPLADSDLAAPQGTEPGVGVGPPHAIMGQLQPLTVTPAGSAMGPLPEPAP